MKESNGKHKNFLVAMFLAWLIPGAGHLYVNKPIKAMLFFCVLFFIYLTGLWMTGFRTIWWSDNPFFFVGYLGSSSTLVASFFLGGGKAFPQEDMVSLFDVGCLYMCIAGALNALVTLSFLGYVSRDKEALKQ